MKTNSRFEKEKSEMEYNFYSFILVIHAILE